MERNVMRRGVCPDGSIIVFVCGEEIKHLFSPFLRGAHLRKHVDRNTVRQRDSDRLFAGWVSLENSREGEVVSESGAAATTSLLTRH
jgi:hypothetical protein